MTAAVCSRCFSSGGKRSIRAARTACTVAGTGMAAGPPPGNRPLGRPQDPGLHQRPHALLQEEGIALRALDQELRQGRQAGVVPQERRRKASALAGGKGSSRSCV